MNATPSAEWIRQVSHSLNELTRSGAATRIDLDDVEMRMEDNSARLSTKVSELEARLSERLDTLSNDLERRLEALEARQEAALERISRELDYRLETLERRMEGRR